MTTYKQNDDEAAGEILSRLAKRIASEMQPPDHEIDNLMATNLSKLYRYGFDFVQDAKDMD